MNLASIEILHLLAAVSGLLLVAHLGGFLAARGGVPPMIGELTGGLLLGPTVFGRIWPAGHAWLLPSVPGSPVAATLAFCSTIGLLVLLFVGGVELRRLLTRKELRPVAWISALGIIVPSVAGLALLQLIDVSPYLGAARHLTALKVVLLIALAITSIPVITRIFLDLGLLNTRLARVVLSVGVIEDVLLYVALSLVLGMVQTDPQHDASFPLRILGLAPGSPASIAWHVTASVVLLAIAMRGAGTTGPTSRLNPIARRSPLGWTLASILLLALAAMVLGLAPMFGALVAGILASSRTEPAVIKAQEQVGAIGAACFIPLYFATIGISLDLVRDFDWRISLGLLVFGTAVKYGGVILGARVAGESPTMARALAVSVNARGGPGLVVASTAFAAGIVNAAAYTSLVLLAVVTSLLAGIILAAWLRTAAVAEVIRGDGGSPGARDG